MSHVDAHLPIVDSSAPAPPSASGSHVTLLRPAIVSSSGTWSSPVTPPLGLAYLAAAVEETGAQVRCIDALAEDVENFVEKDGYIYQGLAIDETVDRVDPNTDVIGVSCMFSQDWMYVKELLAALRRRFPEKCIVVGGEHITALPEYCVRDCPAIDYCILGEGEDTLAALVRKLAAGESPRELPGVAYLDGDQYVQMPAAARIRDVDRLPYPSWDHFPMEVYLETRNGHGVYRGRTMGILATRGCPYKCTFCSNPVMYGKLYVPREPADVLDEIEQYIHKYDCENVDFYDLTMILKRQWVLEFCRLIEERGLKFTWQLPTGTRSEVVDDEVAAALHRTGCRNITYAPESGDPETLDRIKKRVKIPNVLSSIRSSLRNEINVKCNIIIGFPHETRRQVWRTMKFCWKMAVMGVHDVGIFLYSPYPGSQLYDELRDEGMIGPPSDEYFHGLVNFMDPTSTTAFCRHVSGRELKYWRLFGMASFFALSYLIRPWRFVRFVRNVLRYESDSVLEQRVGAIFHRAKTLRQRQQQQQPAAAS